MGRLHHGTEMAHRFAVTVLITVVEQAGTRCIRLAGRLTGEEVGELEHTVGVEPSAVCLDLVDLRSADAAGLNALRRLHAEGVVLRGVPPHLAWRIEADEL
jgi:hypothetical protein